MKTIYQYGQFDNLPLYASLYPANAQDSAITLLYFHGGGLIYGERDDLPKAYIEQLNRNGYNLITFDYPFAPEVTIDNIFTVLQQAIAWFKDEHLSTLTISSDNYCLFGRSAGGYLSLLLANQLKDPVCKGIISFYGYYSLQDPSFNQSSPYYQKYPAVPFMTVYQLTQNGPKTQAIISERFPIYLAYRQTGQWVKHLLGKQNAEDYSLNEEQLSSLPPAFLAASQADQDVPYYFSETMAQLIPEAHLYTVEDLPHDFESNPKLPTSQEAYHQLINWLDSLTI